MNAAIGNIFCNHKSAGTQFAATKGTVVGFASKFENGLKKRCGLSMA
jgi:hypothetical protein